MIEIKEIPVAGAAVGIVVDLLAYGGDTIAAIAAFIVTELDLWLPFLSRLTLLSDVFGWIPAGAIEQLLTWLSIVFVVFYAARIGGRIYDNV